MSLHETRRSPARRIDDLQLLQGLLTQRLYVPEQDRRLLRVLLAETPRRPPTPARARRRSARRLRATSAALALGGALALTFVNPLLPTVAASPAPASWVAAAPAANTVANTADQSDVLLRALINHTATASAAAPADQSDVLLRALLNRAAAPADQSDVLLRALLNRAATANAAITPIDQSSDVLLRALLNAASQAVAPVEQALPQAAEALAQAELAIGETLIIPAASAADAAAATNANAAPLADTYYVVQPGDTLSGIAQAFYGNGSLWPTIFHANTDKIRDPHWIYPNQQLLIPAGGYVIQTTAVPVPARAIAINAQYTVQSGDTLSGIAYAAYGNGNSWWGIFQANTDKICDPDLIFPGQVLRIP